MISTKTLRDLAARSNDGVLRGPAFDAADKIDAQAERIAELEGNLRVRDRLLPVARHQARNEALREAAKAVAPKGDEPSVDPSNHGDTAELAYWREAKACEAAILALIEGDTNAQA